MFKPEENKDADDLITKDDSTIDLRGFVINSDQELDIDKKSQWWAWLLLVIIIVSFGAFLWWYFTKPIVIKSLSDTISTEKENQETLLPEPLDSDNDNLDDEEEEFWGTDPNNPDTDGDGYLDIAEISQGYNPLGSGLLVTDNYGRPVYGSESGSILGDNNQVSFATPQDTLNTWALATNTKDPDLLLSCFAGGILKELERLSSEEINRVMFNNNEYLEFKMIEDNGYFSSDGEYYFGDFKIYEGGSSIEDNDVKFEKIDGEWKIIDL